ncbi:secreted protein [Cadophora sp. MPI-SDFR-AT-0126]|nr:secreted protein [Leotiomycetes sp. MPI-SDFR-AT-0126]
MARLIKLFFFFATLGGMYHASATPSPKTKRNSGSFQNPQVENRPKFRYWLPDASVAPSAVAADVTSIGSIGGGGIELVPFYNYGGVLAPAVTDWSIYGYGTARYNAIVKAALEAAQSSGLVMDLCMGPQSGQGVPASPDNPGLAYDMIYNYTVVAAGGTFEGKIPGYGLGTLISVTTAAIVSESVIEVPNASLGFSGPAPNVNRTVITVSDASLNLVTKNVKRDGTLTVKFPTGGAAKKYMVFAAYYHLGLERACTAGSTNPQNIQANGSFAVDHFSAEGAKVTTDFLEKYVMVNGVRDLFKKVGKYIWEDSLEIASQTFWTPKLQDTFRRVNGYDIDKYVMLLTINNGLSFGINFLDDISTDAPDKGQSRVEDYRSALTVSMKTYLDAMVSWSNRYVNSEFSTQVAYGIPVDMAQLIPEVEAPEDESLGFDKPGPGGSTDLYRQFVGPANLAGKQIISNEMGAIAGKCYQLTLPELLSYVKRAWAVGNNQMVFHGGSYSGQYPKTTWPGNSGFQYLFSEPWSRHQPVWDNGFAEMNDFIARTQWILQSGVPKRDVTLWIKLSEAVLQTSDNSISNNFTDLIAAGYGYEFFSPANLDLPQANVRNKVLAPDGPAYKAVILRGNDLLTLAGTGNLVKIAKQGVPIVIQGDIPTKINSANGLQEAQANIKSILSLKNVKQVGPGPLAPTLASLGVLPRTRTQVSGGTWLTYWRHDDGAKADYVLILNDGTSSSSGTVTFESTGKPFLLNAWTGVEEPVVEYTVSSQLITIPFKFAAGQNVIVVFRDPSYRGPKTYVTSKSSVAGLGFQYSTKDGLSIKVPASTTPGTVTLSNSKKVTIPAQKIPAAITLSNYTLTAEVWTPGADFYDSNTIGTKTNKTFTIQSLQSWPSIAGLENSAGVGYYKTSFLWRKADGATGAQIDFGPVQNTLRVRVNGKQIPPLDTSAATADISAYLVDGQNFVEATAATTLYNGVVPFYSQLLNSGQAPYTPLVAQSVPAGLTGTVVVTPFRLVKLT